MTANRRSGTFAEGFEHGGGQPDPYVDAAAVGSTTLLCVDWPADVQDQDDLARLIARIVRSEEVSAFSVAPEVVRDFFGRERLKKSVARDFSYSVFLALREIDGRSWTMPRYKWKDHHPTRVGETDPLGGWTITFEIERSSSKPALHQHVQIASSDILRYHRFRSELGVRLVLTEAFDEP